MSLQVGKAIYNILQSNENVTNYVGKKIYPLITDSNTTFPFIVYKRTGIQPADTKDRFIYKEDTALEIVVASDKYDISVEIADCIRKALQGIKGTFEGVVI